MPPRKPVTQETVKKLIKEGQGQGELSQYQPWFTIRSFSSRGTSVRYMGQKVKREYHFVGLLEFYFMLYQEFAPIVLDIREQFPLLPLTRTKEIAAQLGIPHPRVKGKDVVMTSDFLLTVYTGDDNKHYARSIKRMKDLSNPRVQQKMAIEKAFWEAQSVNWAYITEAQFNRNFTRNLIVVMPYYSEERLQIPHDLLQAIKFELNEEVSRMERPLFDIARQTDAMFSLPVGTCINVAKHMIAQRIWVVNLNIRLNFQEPLVVLKVF